MDGLPFSAVGVKRAVASGSAVFLRQEWNRDFFVGFDFSFAILLSAALTVTTYFLCVPGFAISLLSLVFSSLPLRYLCMVKTVFLWCVCYAIIRKVIILSHVHPCKCYHFFSWSLLSKASVWSCQVTYGWCLCVFCLLLLSASRIFAFRYWLFVSETFLKDSWSYFVNQMIISNLLPFPCFLSSVSLPFSLSVVRNTEPKAFHVLSGGWITVQTPKLATVSDYNWSWPYLFDVAAEMAASPLYLAICFQPVPPACFSSTLPAILCVPLCFTCHPHLVQFTLHGEKPSTLPLHSFAIVLCVLITTFCQTLVTYSPFCPADVCCSKASGWYPCSLSVFTTLHFVFTVITQCCTLFCFVFNLLLLRLRCQHWRTGLYLFMAVSPTLWIKSSDCQGCRNTFGKKEWNGHAQKSQRAILITPPGLKSEHQVFLIVRNDSITWTENNYNQISVAFVSISPVKETNHQSSTYPWQK